VSNAIVAVEIFYKHLDVNRHFSKYFDIILYFELLTMHGANNSISMMLVKKYLHISEI